MSLNVATDECCRSNLAVKNQDSFEEIYIFKCFNLAQQVYPLLGWNNIAVAASASFI